MGKGRSAPTTSTVVQQNLPDYYEPYALRLMDRAEGASLADYTPYDGQRIADVSPDRAAAYDLTRQVAGQGIPGLDAAFQTTAQNMQAGQDLANVQPYQFGPSQFQMSGAGPYMGFQQGQADPYMGFQQGQVDPYAGFTASRADPYAGFTAAKANPYSDFSAANFGPAGRFSAGDVDQYGGFKASEVNNFAGEFDPYTGFQAGSGEAFSYGPERQFTTQEAQQYMDPYLNTVLGVQKDQAQQDYDRTRANRDARAVQAGAFGGSRAAVQEGLAESEMLDRMARIDAEGRSAAYGQASTQFGADRTAQQQQRERQAQELARTQGISIDEARRVQESQASEQSRVQSARAAELARAQGISIDEAAHVQSGQAAEFARANNLSVEEAARVQTAIADDNARIQNASAAELARIQQSQAAEMARVQGISIDEAARVQQSQAAEIARVQGISIDEAARVQASQAAELSRVQGISVDEFARVQQSQAAELARVQGISIDEAARVQASQAAELARVQGISIDEAARVQSANAAERARVEESQANENARAREQSLAALGFSSDQASQLAGLGEMARAGDIQAAQLLETIGTAIEAQDQAGLDLAYQDFINQRDYDKNQINYLSSVMQGVPVTPETATTTMAPYNPLQQALGAGLGAVGLYRGLTA